jgi:hypothetical protein
MKTKNIIHPKEYKNKQDILIDFKLNGFVSIKNLIDTNLLAKVREDLTKSFQLMLNNNLEFTDNLILLNTSDKPKLYQYHNATIKLMSHFNLVNDIYKALEVLNENKPIQLPYIYYLLGLPNDKRLAYDFHQEGNYMKDAGRIFNIHFPLFQKSTIKNGTMSVLLNSHNEGLLPYVKKRLGVDSYTDLVPVDIDLLIEKYEEAYCELDLGDCFIFDENLIHKSNLNMSDSCRVVGVWRAFGDLNSVIQELKPDQL